MSADDFNAALLFANRFFTEKLGITNYGPRNNTFGERGCTVSCNILVSEENAEKLVKAGVRLSLAPFRHFSAMKLGEIVLAAATQAGDDFLVGEARVALEFARGFDPASFTHLYDVVEKIEREYPEVEVHALIEQGLPKAKLIFGVRKGTRVEEGDFFAWVSLETPYPGSGKPHVLSLGCAKSGNPEKAMKEAIRKTFSRKFPAKKLRQNPLA